jgi:macrodomain Ter protein organizer (MatP/YcbG family)
MRTISVELEDQVLVDARRLADERGCTLSELLAQLICEHRNGDEDGRGVIGMFADIPDVMDEIVRDAYEARRIC